MAEDPAKLDTSIGAAIRAARFSRGLTQGDLAARIGVTRATIASYETGRRKILAETLIQIAHLCGKPLSFFDPTEEKVADRAHEVQATAQHQPAIQAVVQALQVHPDAIPFVMEFLETFLQDQMTYGNTPRRNALFVDTEEAQDPMDVAPPATPHWSRGQSA